MKPHHPQWVDSLWKVTHLMVDAVYFLIAPHLLHIITHQFTVVIL